MLAETFTPTERTRLPRKALVPAPRAGTYVTVKAAADLLLAVVLLVPAAPLMLLAAMLVKLTSRGPVFYSQARLGLDGHPYKIYKIRTMRHNCEKDSGACWSLKGDPRVTAVGRFLRKTHLDELPQLWNVLRGDMSVVGPRPERPEFVPALEEKILGYRERLRVRPGVTGLAQVQLPADTDVDSVRRKLVYDLYYLENMGFWLDLRLVLCTALKVLHVPFAVSGRLLRIPRRASVESSRWPSTTEVPSPAQPQSQPSRLQPEIA